VLNGVFDPEICCFPSEVMVVVEMLLGH